ncbi:putative dynamin-related protein 4A [Capsicum galapagoense]
MDISEKKSIPQEVEDDYVAPIVSSYNDELLRSLFNCVDRLCAAHQFIQPPTVPTIVLVGDRCSGKSSLVASLIGIKLPRFCTRFPVLIKLQNHQSPKLEFSIEFDGMERSSSSTDHDNDEWSVASEITWATNAIADGIVCNKALTVNLKKNGFPNLTIVDLPGIPTTSKYDDQDHTIKETCEQMIMEYITPEDRIILNVLSTSSDSLPNKLESMNMSLKVDEKRERTLVVVTKVDKAPDRFLDELLLDKVTAMGHSYVCVRNNIDSESFKESECAVATLFKLLSIPKTSVGITILARTLMLIQAKITSIDITSKIKDRLVAKVSDLKKLPNQCFGSVANALRSVTRFLSRANKSLLTLFDQLDEDCRSTGARTIVEMLDQYSAELHSIINLENKQGLFLMDEIKYIEERKVNNGLPNDNFLNEKLDMDHFDCHPQLQDSTKKALENLIAKKKDASVNWAREIIEMERLAAGFHTCNYAASCNRLLAQGTSFMDIINNPKVSHSTLNLEGIGEVIDVGHLRKL